MPYGPDGSLTALVQAILVLRLIDRGGPLLPKVPGIAIRMTLVGQSHSDQVEG
ncbi:hypothetical protein [Acrocarpospora pleiomorpha]|uniref:hypothetical protein n=1 Tax=Acrocarpospora pleiomorpha TaxID=90975 RepID=UPI001479136D|nr:hypothetical protein [Acrocarpospora pleiomorpha]